MGSFEAIKDLCAVDRVIRAAVADDSHTNNYSNSYTAKFYREIQTALPFLTDVILECSRQEKLMFALVFGMLESEGRLREGLRVESVTKSFVKIDRSSVLYVALHSSWADHRQLRRFCSVLLKSSPRMLERYEALQREKAIVVIQRRWKRSRVTKRVKALFAGARKYTHQSRITDSVTPDTMPQVPVLDLDVGELREEISAIESATSEDRLFVRSSLTDESASSSYKRSLTPGAMSGQSYVDLIYSPDQLVEFEEDGNSASRVTFAESGV